MNLLRLDVINRVLFAALFYLAGVTVLAQGTVNFVNTPTTLVSIGPGGEETVISGPPGSEYFGLLIAPTGTMELSKFTFSGLYATNSGPGLSGRFSGGLNVPVSGWVGVTKSFLVAGWSSTLGHDWNQQWLSGTFDASGFFGLSPIGTGFPGGPGGGVPNPPLDLFQPIGGTGIHTGWNLGPIPEPSAAPLLFLAAALSMIHYRRRKFARITQ